MPRKVLKSAPWWYGKFIGCGYRLTKPRHLILNVLSQSNEHLSAEDLYLAVHALYPAIGLTTVYRTLELLVQMGLVRKQDFGDKRNRYELAEGLKNKQHHHHLICTSCGKVIEYSDFIQEELGLLNKIEKQISNKYKMKIMKHLIQFYGTCEKCNKES